MGALLASFLLILSSGQGTPADSEMACYRDPNAASCASEHALSLQRLYRVRPIEAHRDAGDQVRRIFYVDGYGRDVVALSFIRARGHEPMLVVDFPHEEGAPDLEALRAPVPAAVWDDVLTRSALFDRQLVPPPPVPAGDEVSLCMHGWRYTIEATDPPQYEGDRATLRRRTESACDDGLTELYAAELRRAAYPLIPHCARLDLAYYRNEASLLQACGILSGDRLAAAEAMNQANRVRNVEGPAETALLRDVFAYDAAVDWNGERAQGEGAGARLWAAKVAEQGRANFFFMSVHGEAPDRVRLIGTLARWAPRGDREEPTFERAPVQQIWTRENGEFALESAVVGPFEPVPQRASGDR